MGWAISYERGTPVQELHCCEAAMLAYKVTQYFSRYMSQQALGPQVE